MATLPGFKRYHELRRSLPPGSISPKLVADLNRVHARLKVAIRFRGLVISPCSAEVRRGYSEGTRLLLMYSAAELLGKTIQPQVLIDTWVMHDEPLATRLRPIARAAINANKSMRSTLRDKVEALANGVSHDVRPVASALRHMMAHGNFSPGGIGAITKRDAEALQELTQRLRDEAVDQFNIWLISWESTLKRRS